MKIIPLQNIIDLVRNMPLHPHSVFFFAKVSVLFAPKQHGGNDLIF